MAKWTWSNTLWRAKTARPTRTGSMSVHASYSLMRICIIRLEFPRCKWPLMQQPIRGMPGLLSRCHRVFHTRKDVLRWTHTGDTYLPTEHPLIKRSNWGLPLLPHRWAKNKRKFVFGPGWSTDIDSHSQIIHVVHSRHLVATTTVCSHCAVNKPIVEVLRRTLEV